MEQRATSASGDQHCTDPVVLGWLARMGGVDFDPCGHPSNLFARSTVLLPHYGRPNPTVISGSGLLLDWSGRGLLYANMPFSDIAPWLRKAPEADSAVLLVPARLNAAYMHETAFQTAAALHIPRRRVIFRNAKTQPPWHSVFFYWGDDVDLFAHAFHEGVTLPLPGISHGA